MITKYKDLLYELIKRNLKRRYSESFLGFLWYIIEPLVFMSIIIFVFTVIFPRGRENFAVFYLCGSLVFRFFSSGTSSSLRSIIQDGNLIKARRLPREIFPISQIIVALISSVFDLIILFIFMIIFGVPFQILLLFIPLFLLLETLIILGIGLILSVLYVRFRDLNVIWTLINRMLFWVLPIVYDISLVPVDYQLIYKLNPLTLLILDFRDVVLNYTIPSWENILYIVISGLILFLIGYFLFNRSKKNFAEKI